MCAIIRTRTGECPTPIANDHRPDTHSKDYKLVRRFSARDGSLKLTPALGFELAATLNGRKSKVLVI
ncbi:MAG TPA: hypothetical protein VKU44_04300 [Terriglobia bacterium]|nr:hypothetical protein [Terriglobia bacterium]